LYGDIHDEWLENNGPEAPLRSSAGISAWLVDGGGDILYEDLDLGDVERLAWMLRGMQRRKGKMKRV
jgi:hypothetical protein